MRRVLLSCLLAAAPARAEVLRILVARGLSEVQVAGTDLRAWAAPPPELAATAALHPPPIMPCCDSAPARALDEPAASPEDGGPEAAPGAPLAVSARALTLAASGEQVRVDEKPAGAPVVVIRGAGPIAVAGRTVRGQVEIRARGGALVVVNALDLEDYVAAVVGAEMATGWPAEALKAQAVATRTYALSRKLDRVREPWHLSSDVLSQVYHGIAREAPDTRAAAQDTRGELVTYKRAPARTYFHSTCGGATVAAEEAFGAASGAPYLIGVACGDDGRAPRAAWELSVPLAELPALLARAGVKLSRVDDLRVVKRAKSGRAARVEVRGGDRARVLGAADLRRAIGWERLHSLWFEVDVGDGVARFRGRGSGHGVGLCQWGARGMALAGADYRAILTRYYPGTEIRRMY